MTTDIYVMCVCLTKSEPFLNGTDGALRAPNWTLGRAKRKGVGGKEFLPALTFRRRRISCQWNWHAAYSCILITSLADIIVFVNLFAW